MTVANTIVAKASVAFVAIAMAFSLVAPAIAAEDVSEMSLEELIALVQKLQGAVTGGDSMSCAYTFTSSMGQGATGAEVMTLQKFLNMDAETRVAVSGAGSPGMETQYYGPATAAAVSKFQVKYRAEVLTPLGLVNPTGYWGNSSIAQANKLCVSNGGEDGDDDTTSGDLDGGEASLEDFNGKDGDDTDAKEGQDDAEVAIFEFDVEDGDVEVNRIDVAFAADSSNDAGADDDPWDVFDEIMIYVDGDEIASMDASDEDEWSDDEPTTGQHTLRFSGLDWVVREGDTAEFSVVVSVAGSVDEADTTPTWYVFIPEDGIRAEDGVGIQNYIGESDASNADPADYDEEVNFDIDEEGGDDELDIGSSSEDPDATTLMVKESQKSDWMTIFAFDLDTDDSENDIEVETATVGLIFGGSESYGSMINDARLVIDGDEYDDYTVSSTSNANTTLTFDLDKDLVIDAGEEVTAEFQVQFKAQSGNYDDGDTIQATSTATGWEAEGADDLTVGDTLTGSATGDTHTVRTEGVTVEFVSSTETFKENSDATTTDNEGVFTMKFDVTAFEDDIYFEKTTDRSTTTSNQAVNYIIEDSNGDEVVSDGAANAVLTSTADTESGYFVVRDGETETFTLTVNYNPALGDEGDFFQVQLYSVNYNVGATGAPDSTQRALPESDFETDPLSI